MGLTEPGKDYQLLPPDKYPLPPNFAPNTEKMAAGSVTFYITSSTYCWPENTVDLQNGALRCAIKLAMEALVINRKLYQRLFVYVSFLLFFFPLRRRQVFIFVASLRITMKTPLGNAHICFADGSSGKLQTGHWHFTCMKTNTSTYYHINTSAAQPNYRGQSLQGIFRSPHFQAENTFFRLPNVNGG